MWRKFYAFHNPCTIRAYIVSSLLLATRSIPLFLFSLFFFCRKGAVPFGNHRIRSLLFDYRSYLQSIFNGPFLRIASSSIKVLFGSSHCDTNSCLAAFFPMSCHRSCSFLCHWSYRTFHSQKHFYVSYSSRSRGFRISSVAIYFPENFIYFC